MRAIDWRAWRGSIVLVVFAAAIGTVAAGGALRLHAEASRDYEREKGRLEAVRSRYRTIDERKRLIETWLPAYRSLQATGVIGEERRLEWIEALREASARVGLPSLRYRNRAPYAIRGGARPRYRRPWRVLDGRAYRGRPLARSRSGTSDPGAGGRGSRAAPHRALRRPPLGAGLRDAPRSRQSERGVRSALDHVHAHGGAAVSRPVRMPTGSPKATLTAAWLAGAVALVAPNGDSQAQSRIGRLFSSPEQRAELDRLREESDAGDVAAPASDPPEGESPRGTELATPALAATLNGILVRGDGPSVAWIDGIETLAGASTPGGGPRRDRTRPRRTAPHPPVPRPRRRRSRAGAIDRCGRHGAQRVRAPPGDGRGREIRRGDIGRANARWRVDDARKRDKVKVGPTIGRVTWRSRVAAERTRNSLESDPPLGLQPGATGARCFSGRGPRAAPGRTR